MKYLIEVDGPPCEESVRCIFIRGLFDDGFDFKEQAEEYIVAMGLQNLNPRIIERGEIYERLLLKGGNVDFWFGP